MGNFKSVHRGEDLPVSLNVTTLKYSLAFVKVPIEVLTKEPIKISKFPATFVFAKYVTTFFLQILSYFSARQYTLTSDFFHFQ